MVLDATLVTGRLIKCIRCDTELGEKGVIATHTVQPNSIAKQEFVLRQFKKRGTK